MYIYIFKNYILDLFFKILHFILDCVQRDAVLDEISKPQTAFSKLWDSEFRNEVTAAQVPEAVLNKERGKYVIPKGNIRESKYFLCLYIK